jgi:hypothetical protein
MIHYLPLNDKHAAEVEFYNTYFDIPAASVPSFLYSDAPANECDVYVIAFNNPLLVEYQIKTFRAFFKTPHNLIIVDNNNGLHAKASRQVFEICERENVIYLQAPANIYQQENHFDPTMKLGTTMNWLYLNCVRTRRPKYFGYMDQDCFPIAGFDIRPALDARGMYGRVVRSQKVPAWTLHVTVNYYRYDFVSPYILDFRAQHNLYLDTGSANFPILYKQFDPDQYEIKQQTFRYAEADVNRKDSVQHYEILDDVWFHMGASSHDQLAGDGSYKLAYTKGFLDGRLWHG